MSTCGRCGTELVGTGSVAYLSGDKVLGHLERRVTQVDTVELVFVVDEEDECDSVYWCMHCGSSQFPSPDRNEMWD